MLYECGGSVLFICVTRSLHCDRITIHKQLVGSFALRSIVIFIIFEPFVTGRQTLSYRNLVHSLHGTPNDRYDRLFFHF